MKIEEYVKNALNNKSLVPFSAEKIERVLATKDDNGTTWTIILSDNDGNPILDKDGNKHVRVLKDDDFKELYYPDSNMDMIYLPKEDIQLFAKLNEDIKVLQNDIEILLEEGNYVNITNDNNIYYVLKEDFDKIYKRMDGIDHYYD